MKSMVFILLTLSICPTFANEELCSELKKKIAGHRSDMASSQLHSRSIDAIKKAQREIEEVVKEYSAANFEFMNGGNSSSVYKMIQARSKERSAAIKLTQSYQDLARGLQGMIANENTFYSLMKQAEDNNCQ